MKRTIEAMKSITMVGALLLAFSSSQATGQAITPSLETHGSMEASNARGSQHPVLSPWVFHDHEIHIYFIGDPRGLLTIRNENSGEERNFKLAHFANGALVMDALDWLDDSAFPEFRSITIEVSGNVDGLTFGGRFGPEGTPQFDGAGHAIWTGDIIYE